MSDTSDDWRAAMLARMRGLIMAADPKIVEEVKWRKPTNSARVLVWSRAGIVCTDETYAGKVKLTFARGAALDDPAGLFNTGDGNVRRAIDLAQGVTFDEAAFKDLVRAVVAANIAVKH